MTPTLTKIIITIITIITSGAVLSFIQFLIQRNDKKEESFKEASAESLRQDFRDHLTEVNDAWKVKYCDRNYQMIEDLTEEMREGLAERENKGLERYQEHKETINELKEAVLQLVKNDTDMKEYMETIGQSLIGLSHDKILTLSDKYTERGAITLKEKATIQSIYNPYKKLGGNGDCEVAFNYINTLPVISDEKAKILDNEIETKKGGK